MNQVIQIKRNVTDDSLPTGLLPGELAYVQQTNKLYIGRGSDPAISRIRDMTWSSHSGHSTSNPPGEWIGPTSLGGGSSVPPYVGSGNPSGKTWGILWDISTYTTTGKIYLEVLLEGPASFSIQRTPTTQNGTDGTGNGGVILPHAGQSDWNWVVIDMDEERLWHGNSDSGGDINTGTNAGQLGGSGTLFFGIYEHSNMSIGQVRIRAGSASSGDGFGFTQVEGTRTWDGGDIITEIKPEFLTYATDTTPDQIILKNEDEKSYTLSVPNSLSSDITYKLPTGLPSNTKKILTVAADGQLQYEDIEIETLESIGDVENDPQDNEILVYETNQWVGKTPSELVETLILGPESNQEYENLHLLGNLEVKGDSVQLNSANLAIRDKMIGVGVSGDTVQLSATMNNGTVLLEGDFGDIESGDKIFVGDGHTDIPTGYYDTFDTGNSTSGEVVPHPSENYTINQFTIVGTDTFVIDSPLTNVDILIIGGGGGSNATPPSGSLSHGAGSAGGFIYYKGISLAAGTYDVTVGADSSTSSFIGEGISYGASGGSMMSSNSTSGPGGSGAAGGADQYANNSGGPGWSEGTSTVPNSAGGENVLFEMDGSGMYVCGGGGGGWLDSNNNRLMGYHHGFGPTSHGQTPNPGNSLYGGGRAIFNTTGGQGVVMVRYATVDVPGLGFTVSESDTDITEEFDIAISATSTDEQIDGSGLVFPGSTEKSLLWKDEEDRFMLTGGDLKVSGDEVYLTDSSEVEEKIIDNDDDGEKTLSGFDVSASQITGAFDGGEYS